MDLRQNRLAHILCIKRGDMTIDKKEYNRQYYRDHIEHRYPSQTKTALKEQRLKRRYNMTLEEYNTMLLQQENKCVICLKEFDDNTFNKPQVDHNHQTGEVRALLCIPCNTMLGKASESTKTLESCIRYLQQFKLSKQIAEVLQI